MTHHPGEARGHGRGAAGAGWLEAPVTAVEGVSGRTAVALRNAFGIETVRDLVEHYPHTDRYRDTGAWVLLSDARIGQPVTVVGAVARWQVLRPRRRGTVRAIAKAVVVDDGGGRVEVPFFNQDWRPRQAPEGTRVAISGTLERFRGSLQLKSPTLTVLGDSDELDGSQRIQATYPATEGLASWRIARFVEAALDRLPRVDDHLPGELLRRHDLRDLDSALRGVHRPGDLAEAEAARDRLVYDELLCLQLGVQGRRARLESGVAGVDNTPGPRAASLLEVLPFAPTEAQRRAFEEIGADLARGSPMHRLLQGDVGSGKTLVAAWAMLGAVDRARQAVLMAPTEILAEQHFRTLSALLAPLGVNVLDGPRLDLLTGSAGRARLRTTLAELAGGSIDLLVGTHALLEERVVFGDLGVVVIDEQHRFGVEHRARLRDKRSDHRAPDVLVMTATPIPRSLALTLYGDLDVTVLDELPPGRQEVVTQVIDAGSPRRDRLLAFIRERVAAGERAYVVCPLVTESEALGEQVAAAEPTYRHLADHVFPDLDVGLVHGRLPPAERDATMEAFRRGGVQVLVATTVIEVGVDVPEATVMMIEDADRFGISQLHQLRGRVGRGRARSYCVLFARGAQGNPRLEALAATTDGFALAETDLTLRGEGSLFDTRQSGLPDLKLAQLVRDRAWVERTRADARELVATDPVLEHHPSLRAEVARRYGEERLAAMETG